jgi:S1-C subfamily serine protease
VNLLDLILVLVVLGYAMSGYWQGFLVGVSATAGLLGGGLLGIVLAPVVLDGLDDSVGVSLAALAGVLVLASLGQVLGGFLGSRVRSYVTWSPARVVDAVGGAALSLVASLLVVWVLGYVISGARIPWLGNQVRDSAVLSTVDEVMPDAVTGALDSFDELVGSDLFPRFLEPFVPERIVPVAPPDSVVLRDPDVRRAAGSVVKVVGEAAECDRGLTGSGFVYAPGRVMTNAHVVAGVSELFVQVDGDQLDAEVVLFDPDLDVAVLAVGGLEVPALRFDGTGRRGDSGAVLGFPDNGPFAANAARIRDEQQLRSPDIYNDDSSLREVFSVRATVRPGNSGGPLVSNAGRVYGLVFAASVTDATTGYALTAEQVAGPARQGRSATQAASTGDCA